MQRRNPSVKPSLGSDSVVDEEQSTPVTNIAPEIEKSAHGLVDSTSYSNAKPLIFISRNRSTFIIAFAFFAAIFFTSTLTAAITKSGMQCYDEFASLTAKSSSSKISYSSASTEESSMTPISKSTKATDTDTIAKSIFSGDGSVTLSNFASIDSGNKGPKFDLAYDQSWGFFDDIPNDSWRLMKRRVRESIKHLYPENPMKEYWLAWRWYQDNVSIVTDSNVFENFHLVLSTLLNDMFQWEPDFTCQHERRVGGTGMGDGPKCKLKIKKSKLSYLSIRIT